MKNLLFLSIFFINVAFSQEKDSLSKKTTPPTFRTEEVDYWNLADSVHIFGTLTMPANGTAFPAVLLITGSGLQDRDETILGHKPFKVIAEYLTNRGFAVLRVDDRAFGKTTKGNKNPKDVTMENFATDVSAGVDYLKTRKEVNPQKVGLIGHSEGGLIAAMVAGKRKDVAYMVSLAGDALKGRQVAENQIRIALKKANIDSVTIEKFCNFNGQMLSEIAKGEDNVTFEKNVRDIIQQAKLNFTEQQLKSLGLSNEEILVKQVKQQNINYVRFFMSYDPAEAWSKVKCPVLAMNGTKDTQVDAKLHLAVIENSLKKAQNTHYKIEKLEGLNHLFQHANSGLLSEYASLKEDFAPEALQTMGDWLVETVSKTIKTN